MTSRPPVFLMVLVTVACANEMRLTDAGTADPRCIEAYRAMDEAVMRAGVRDAEATPVEGFPNLRASRFLASFAGRDLADEASDAWVARMADLDRDARQIELANLDAVVLDRLHSRVRTLDPTWSDAHEAAERCSERLLAAAQVHPDRIHRAVEVPEDYSILARTLGLYPLSAIPVSFGYREWQSDNLPVFDLPVDRPMLEGEPVLFQPAAAERLSSDEVASLLARAESADPLGVPDVAGDRLRALARTFAPTLLVDVAGVADRIGHPVWRDDGLPGVDPFRPVAFVRLEHSWFDGRPIAQLVYLFWFDARPKDGPVDLLAGRLDGLVWRVSLGPDGRPIVYDTIHACGCYHLFFPAPGTTPREVSENDPADPRDPILVPAAADVVAPDQHIVIRIASGSHYVAGTGSAELLDGRSDAVVDYDLVIDDPPDASLRSMPTGAGGRRSLYGPDGIVDGTERAERVLLWPMGITEPGAMRQWGRHATAFVGERHFDDPHLIERAFER